MIDGDNYTNIKRISMSNPLYPIYVVDMVEGRLGIYVEKNDGISVISTYRYVRKDTGKYNLYGNRSD